MPRPVKRPFRWHRRDRQRGFTLLEALVALAVTSAVLAALATLMSANVRTSSYLIERNALLQTGRAVVSALPKRGSLRQGALTGNVQDTDWRIDVRPFPMQPASSREPAWRPNLVVVQVRSPHGHTIRIDTIRLEPTGAQ